jgi:hypothetical protein
MAGLDVTQLAVLDRVDDLPGRSPAVAALREMHVHYRELLPARPRLAGCAPP